MNEHVQEAAPCKVLLIDDEAWVSETLEILLKEEGFDVTTTADGAAALQAASSRSFTVVIMDWRLNSEPHGYALLESLGALLPAAGVIAISGDTAMLDTLAMDRRYPNLVTVQKPIFDFDAFIQQVRTLSAAASGQGK